MATQTASVAIATVDPVLDQYFRGFNREDYGAVATLFDPEGVLRPPFEEGIFGPDAIRTYLDTEARGMRATPLEAEVIPLDDSQRQIIVKGRVKALVFTVNVQWAFILTAENTILDAHIKLLASLQELMQINRGDKHGTQD